MPISQEDLMTFLKDRQIFKDLEEEEIEKIASRMEEIMLPQGEVLFSEGDEAVHFYILYNGRIRAWQGDDEEKVSKTETSILEIGDKIGAESMLYRRERQINTQALENSTLLALERNDFEWMLEEYPETKNYLALIADSRMEARHRRFDWLHKREAIHIITQRHPVRLVIDLMRPLVVIILSAAAALVGLFGISNFPWFTITIGTTFLIFGFLWAIWDILDWRNDYFIITSQRVVWLERVLLQGATRREAPLAAIQSVDMQTSQISRIFGYGNVLVRTFTGVGSMTLTDVNRPKEFMGEIQELLLRVRKKTQVTYEEKLRYSVRQSLGLETENVEDPVFRIETPAEEPTRGLALLRTREVSPDGLTITYHKHWWVLMIKTILPLLGLIGWTGLFIYGLFNEYTIFFFSPQPTTYIFIWIIGTAGFGGVLAYHYADWKNDIYKINMDDMIIDAEKKPFGEEISRSAPIRNIISLEHNRIGILRLILNFGNVEVVVADTTLTFYDVHNPAQVQQDIYYRQEQIRMKAEEKERDEDLNQIARWLRAYHEVTEEERRKEQRRLAEEEEDEFEEGFE